MVKLLGNMREALRTNDQYCRPLSSIYCRTPVTTTKHCCGLTKVQMTLLYLELDLKALAGRLCLCTVHNLNRCFSWINPRDLPSSFSPFLFNYLIPFANHVLSLMVIGQLHLTPKITN
ncbi:hypothetical protein DAI22_02g202301 [Oryza sativa Japonica Group]|nr:hypothetical protein DAI22_02g202301 [Oryza sativa Japonica Group]